MSDQPPLPPLPPDQLQPYHPPSGFPQQEPAPGYMPPPIGPGAAVSAAGGMQQFGGQAAWSIGFGLVSMVAPFFTSFHFPILPLLGLLYGVRAIQRRRLIGGVVGIVLNLLGGLVALIASGILNPGG